MRAPSKSGAKPKPKLDDIVQYLTDNFMASTTKMQKFEECVRFMLHYIGEDPNREGLKETPARVRRFFEEALIPQTPPKISVFTASTQGQVIQKGIPFSSFCEHHLLPFMGTAHVGYMPRKGKVIGLSKLARIVDHFAGRLQLQERLTEQIADYIMKIPNLKPHGVMVVMSASHQCMECRGVKKHDTITVTSEIRGTYLSLPVREEFLSLIKSI